MPGYGALRNLAMREAASTEQNSKKLKTMTIHAPNEAEGRKNYTVEHDYHAPHGRESFKFSPAEQSSLSAHLSKHLGLKLPGKATGGESAEPEVSKSDFK